MLPSARVFYCNRCDAQVVVCRRCDRGQRYCFTGCANKARAESVRRAGHRYRQTRRARHASAERQRRFRARAQEKVTHHGSADARRLALLLLALNTLLSEQQHAQVRIADVLYCHGCQCECDPFLRRDYLRPPSRRRALRRRR